MAKRPVGPRHSGDLLVVGERIHLFDERESVVGALLIRDGLVIGAGSREQMLGLGRAEMELLDVGGATVMPGLIDTHPHALHFTARHRSMVDLTDARDHEDIVQRIRARAAVTPPGHWIVATPVGEPHYFLRRSYRDLCERRLPNRQVLDEATTQHPVVIQAWGPTTPNICSFNSKGLDEVGLSDLVPDRVCDVMIEKDDDGALTGILRGAVNNYYSFDPFWTQLLLKLPGSASWDLRSSGVAAMAELNRLGVTTIYEPHNMAPSHIETSSRLRDEGALTVRVMASLESEGFNTPPFRPASMQDYRKRLELGRTLIEDDDDMFRVTGITFSPGSPAGPGLIRMHEPYEGPFGAPTTGVTFLSAEKQRTFVEFCYEHGIRANFCVAGYRDNDDVLTEIERLADRDRVKNQQCVIQHAILISEDQVKRFAALGCVITTSMGFSWAKGDLYGRRIGCHVWRDLIPLRRMIREGLSVAGSSDWGPKNPWEQIMLAETHEFAGSGHRNDTSDHAISRREAILMWTREAGCVLRWQEIGTLRPGSYADLIVVDRDPLTCPLEDLPSVRVLLTILGGRKVFEGQKLDS